MIIIPVLFTAIRPLPLRHCSGACRAAGMSTARKSKYPPTEKWRRFSPLNRSNFQKCLKRRRDAAARAITNRYGSL
jgi:hypothetical protein